MCVQRKVLTIKIVWYGSPVFVIKLAKQTVFLNVIKNVYCSGKIQNVLPVLDMHILRLAGWTLDQKVVFSVEPQC